MESLYFATDPIQYLLSDDMEHIELYKLDEVEYRLFIKIINKEIYFGIEFLKFNEYLDPQIKNELFKKYENKTKCSSCDFKKDLINEYPFFNCDFRANFHNGTTILLYQIGATGYSFVKSLEGNFIINNNTITGVYIELYVEKWSSGIHTNSNKILFKKIV